MTAGTRNAAVVFTLILSMTVGARLLIWLEPWPEKPPGHALALLMAERATPVQDVEILYAASAAEAQALNQAPDSFCAIDPAGNPELCERRGPRIRLVMIGTGADKLADCQKLELLSTLCNLQKDNGLDLSRVRLAPESDVQRVRDLPPAAGDLRQFLVNKGIIDKGNTE